jgi:choline dehydrogenase-like flavoprotein
MNDLAERSGVTQGEAPPPASARRPRIVIIGAGFGGLSAAQRLARVAADVIVIDRRNHHLFQPLLYQVATAALSPADIAAPIRGILSRQPNTVVILGTVTGIDLGALREPDRRRRDEERPCRSEQKTATNQNDYLTGKAPYKSCELSVPERRDGLTEGIHRARVLQVRIHFPPA